MSPGRGAAVTRLTLADVEEIYTIRLALEPIALGRAMPHFTPAHYARFEGVLDRIDFEEDMTMWAELNWEFHSALYEAANMPRLVQTIQSLHHNVTRYLLTNYLDQDYLAESQRQHRQILDACRAGDVDGALLDITLAFRGPGQRIQGHPGDLVTVARFRKLSLQELQMAIDLPEDIHLPFFDIYDYLTRDEILDDYRIAYLSRQVSLIGRKEVLSGTGQVRHFWRR